MATSPIPSPNGDAPQGRPGGISGMMGSPTPNSMPSPNAQEQAKDTVRQVIGQIQQLTDAAQTVARQFPDFAESAKAIAEACKAGQTKIVGNALRGLEGPPPPTSAV